MQINGLFDVTNGPDFPDALLDFARSKGGHHNRRNLWLLRRHTGQQVKAIHHGHLQVGHKQVHTPDG